MDLKAGLRVDFAQMTQTSYNLDEPIPRDKLEQSIKTMQSNVPRGYVVEKAGQVRIGDRLWIWHEQRIPTFDLSMAKQYQEMLRLWPYASARTWSFVATSQSQLVRVYFTVLYPRDAPVSEIDLRTRQAGSVFAAILRHLVFDVV